jgi:N-acetylmuramoyl-L-alanine amidase
LKTLERSRRFRGTLVLLLALSAPAFSRTFHSDAWARDKFEAAERTREALNGRPANDRTRRDYQRAIDAYRRVYFGAPGSAKADPSVVATAELLVEMGRRFDDDKVLRSAIKQYEFLRREYPGSKYRVEALFTIGEIYKDDLNDADQARSTFQQYLKKYPHSRSADDARDSIAQLDKDAAKESAKSAAAKKATANSASNADQDAGDQASTTNQHGKMPRVTGIRHWSTPDYTRVAIDLEQDVKFDSQRLDRPNRIFFDLYDTKLASTLVGKSFDVEDGFLKKVRVAQFNAGKTRIVLEVDDLSQYNAFLLPNPTRLIIDIHGKETAKAVSSKEAEDIAAAKSEKPSPKVEQTALPATVENGKTAKPASPTGTNPGAQVPVHIVEADDDPETSSHKRGTGKVSKASKKEPLTVDSGAPAVASYGKRKSADGNDDEVATLDPTDMRPEPKASSVTATSSGSSSKLGQKRKHTAKPTPPELEVREAQPTARGDRSLIRALGLKIGRIVIDPGHGGHDTGTIGPNGLQEKNLVLDVSKRLSKLLQTRLGADVVFTRQDDTFIPLETRTAIANQEQADLFVSIHANSSHDPDARGVETYYLNFTSNADALEVAARENAVSDKSIHELQDLVKKIALKEKIEESREFASDVQRSLHSGLVVKSPGLRDRGVKKAPFIVLIGANMPSILAEISFVSNPGDERKLETAEYRQRIAESLYKGISKYISGLSGVKVASRMTKNEGQ